MKVAAWGRLLRLSLAPSAAADVAAGLTIAHSGVAFAPWLWWLVPSSLCIYHGSMALNDWADRAEDARVRPDRPIPSGAIPPRTALAAALLLLIGGVAFAALALPAAALWMGGVALCASFYNVAGRGPWLGPLLLATCRAGNLGVGWFCVERLQSGAIHCWSFGGPPEPPDPYNDGPPYFVARVVVAYFLYVFFVSRLGRLEDQDEREPLGALPGVHLFAAATALASIVLFASYRERWYWLPAVAVALAGSFGLFRTALTTAAWDRPRVLRAMGMSLRRLLVFTAAATLLAVPQTLAWVVAGAILAGYPLSYALRRVFPPS